MAVSFKSFYPITIKANFVLVDSIYFVFGLFMTSIAFTSPSPNIFYMFSPIFGNSTFIRTIRLIGSHATGHEHFIAILTTLFRVYWSIFLPVLLIVTLRCCQIVLTLGKFPLLTTTSVSTVSSTPFTCERFATYDTLFHIFIVSHYERYINILDF